MKIIYSPEFTGIEEFHSIVKADFNDKVKQLENVLTALFEIGENLHAARVKVPMNKRNFEMMFFRFALISSSIYTLFKNGSPLFKMGEEAKRYHDLSGINTLLRSQLENYLIFEHLIFDKICDNERTYRNDLYELSGLCRRQLFSASNKETKEKKKKEKLQIEQIRKKMAQNVWLSENETEKKNVKKNLPKAHLKSIEELILSSELNTQSSLNNWRLFSNHTHAEYLSAIQTHDFLLNYSNSPQTLDVRIQATLQLVCSFIMNMKYETTSSRITFFGFKEELRELITTWHSLSTQD